MTAYDLCRHVYKSGFRGPVRILFPCDLRHGNNAVHYCPYDTSPVHIDVHFAGNIPEPLPRVVVGRVFHFRPDLVERVSRIPGVVVISEAVAESQ